MWVCNVARLKVGTAEKIYTKHLPGFSIIEQEFKGMDENSPEIYAKNENLSSRSRLWYSNSPSIMGCY
jgi:hypothetical protein